MRSIGTLTAHGGSSSVQGSVEPARREVVTDQDQRRDAVDRAYREHADDVYRVAFAILRDTEAAVDATHDTFARAFERWNQYDSNRSLQAWLHGIVSHAALDALRRRRVRRLAVPAVAQIGPLSTGGAWGAADPSIGIADRDLVEAAMADLKPDVRAASDVGRHVYAAADGGPSSAGDPAPEFGASITAYNASDGSVAVLAGRLLARDLTLGEPICR